MLVLSQSNRCNVTIVTMCIFLFQVPEVKFSPGLNGKSSPSKKLDSKVINDEKAKEKMDPDISTTDPLLSTEQMTDEAAPASESTVKHNIVSQANDEVEENGDFAVKITNGKYTWRIDGEEPVLHDLNLSIQSGKCIEL